MAFVNGLGLMVDDIQITGQMPDGAEVTVPWVYSPPTGGFRVVQGDLGSFFNAYVAEFRQYLGYDKGLRTGPYVFGDLNSPATAGLGDAFPVSGRLAHLLLGHALYRQQHQLASGPGIDPAHRCASHAAAAGRRGCLGLALSKLRLDVRA